jgi:sensor histidine kinase regulating citrate/malate metabolism
MTYNKEITETKDFFLSVIESAPYGIITIDSDGLISMANSQAIFSLDIKWNRRDVVGKNIGEIILQPSELKIALKS